tara:strand:- start:4987 stop:8607 length:3621 start_codon:yes stop_codon:yes gene_type:complete
MFFLFTLGNGGISQVQGGNSGLVDIPIDIASFDNLPDLRINHEINPEEKINTKLTRVSDDLIMATLYIENILETSAEFPGNAALLFCENGSNFRTPQGGLSIPGNSYVKIEVEFRADSLAGWERFDTNQHSIPCTINPDKQFMEASHVNNHFNLRLFHPDKYPDWIWTEVTVTPDPIVATAGNTNCFTITAKGENIGADLSDIPQKIDKKNAKRGVTFMVSLPTMYYPVTGDDIQWLSELLTIGPNGIQETNNTFSWEYKRCAGHDEAGIRWSPEPRKFEIYFVDDIAGQESQSDSKYPGVGPVRWGGNWAAMIQTMDEWAGWWLLYQPLEFGSEDNNLRLGYMVGAGDPLPDSVTSNNLHRGSVFTVKPPPDVLYPDDGKVFQVGEYPDFQDDWYTCNGCLPGILPKEIDSYYDWRLAWVDNELLRFRWKYWHYRLGYDAWIQIYDSTNKIVFDKDLSAALGPELTGYVGSTETGLTADDETDMAFTFQQYIGPDLSPGTYKWRVKLGDKNTDDFMAPWSDFRSFTVTTNNLSGSDFTGKVTGVDSDNQQANIPGKAPGMAMPLTGSLANSMVLTVTTEDGSVVPVIADESTTIVNPMNADDIQEIETDWNVMVTANQPPAMGAYLSRSYMATASEITVIPAKPLGSHKRCTVVGETSDGKSSLACEDGEEIDVDQTGLPAGTNAVILVHPEQAAQVISTAKSLMERMSRFQTSAQNQEIYDFVALDALMNNVNAGFFESQEMAIAQASPEVQLFMENLTNLEQRIASLAAGFASGGDNIVVSTGDIEQLIVMLNEVAASPDKLVDMMIDDGGEDTSPQEDRDELKALIKSKSAAFFSTMSADLYQTIALLEEGNIEAALVKLDDTTADSEAWDQNTVVPIMTQFYGDMEGDLITQFNEESEQLREDANAEIAMVEELLSEEDTSWMESDVKASIENNLSQLKAAVAGDDTGVILSALKNMVTAMQALPAENKGIGQEGDGSMQEVFADAHAEIDFARDTMESNAEYITPEDMAIIEGGISDLQGAMDGTDREAIYAAIMSLAGILEALQFEGTGTTSTGSSESSPLTFVNIQCPPMIVVGHQMGCSFSYDGMLESHEWTAAFSGDGSQVSSGSQLFTATYDQLGTVSLNLTACDSNSCLQASHTIEIVEPKKNGGEHTPDDQGDQEGLQSGDQQGDHVGDQGDQEEPQSGDQQGDHVGDQGNQK